MNTGNKKNKPICLQSAVKTLLLIGAFLFISACSQTLPKTESVNLEDLAIKAFKAKDFIASRAYYEQAIQQSPSIKSYIGLAESFEGLENWHNAAEVWLAVSRIEGLEQTNKGEYIINASKSLLRSNNAKGAREVLLSLDEKQIEKRDAQSVFGLIAVFEGHKEIAISHFIRILKESPSDQSALNNLGLSYLVFGDTINAIKILENLTNEKSSILNHAIALAYAGKEDDAYSLLKDMQTDEEALQAITFAQHLKDQSEKTRAEMLFGISPNQ